MPNVKIDGQTIDTKELINPPYIECPRCHKTTYGILHVGISAYLRACTECPFPDAKKGEKPELIALPKIDKEVLYLDQHVISSIAKALRPELQRTKMEPHVQKEWIALYYKIDRLRRLQQIVCPFSMYHRRESFRDQSLYKHLKAVYKRLANGVEFYESMEVQAVQILQFTKHHLNPAEPIFIDDPQLIAQGRINSWEQYSLKSALRSYTWDPVYAEMMKQQEIESKKVFQKIYDTWKRGDMTIEERIEQESKGYGNSIRETYALYFMKRGTEEVGIPLPPDLAPRINKEIWDEHPYIKLVDDVYELFSKGAKIVNPFVLREVIDFLAGDALRKSVPSIRIEPLLWATLARQAAATRGRKEEIDLGDSSDISSIANLLPYCDGIMIDKPWHGRLKNNPAKTEMENYTAVVYSRSNLQELMDHLDDLEKNVPPHILKAVQEVYGDIREEDPFTNTILFPSGEK